MKKSLTGRLYAQIFEDILSLKLKPGGKIHIANMAQKYEVGLSPVREALSRLLKTGLVIAKSQKGFIIAPISKEDLWDLYLTRIEVEKVALRLSMEKGDENWEANLLATFHSWTKFEKNHDLLVEENTTEWEKRHRAFNLALIQACELKHLLQVQENLFQQTVRYRHQWLMQVLKKKKIPTENLKNVMYAAIAREVKALELLEAHYLESCHVIEITLFS